jgi:glutathione S-transferase
MELYFLPGTCALADHIVLEWIGRPYEAKQLSHEALKSPQYLKLNPAGVVPTLVDDDGWVLTENAAILNYLLDRFPETGLGGDGSPRARATVNRWLAFINSDVHKSFAPLFSPGRFHPDHAQHDILRERARGRIRDQLSILDKRLGEVDWLAGHKSPADAYLFVVLRWARKSGVDLSGFDALDGFFDRMKADAGVKRALEAQGLS